MGTRVSNTIDIDLVVRVLFTVSIELESLSISNNRIQRFCSLQFNKMNLTCWSSVDSHHRCDYIISAAHEHSQTVDAQHNTTASQPTMRSACLVLLLACVRGSAGHGMISSPTPRTGTNIAGGNKGPCRRPATACYCTPPTLLASESGLPHSHGKC